MSKKESKKSSKELVLRIALAAIVPLISIVAIAIVSSTGVIPAKYFWPASLVWLAVSALIGYGIFRADKKQAVRTTISILIAIIITVINIVAINYASGVNSLFGNIQESQLRTQPYYLITLESESADYETTPTTNIGHLIFDPYTKDVESFIKSELKTATTGVSDPTALSVAINNQSLDSALINDAYLSLYEENYPEFYNAITVVATYNIPVTADVIETNKTSVAEPFVVYVSGIDVRSNDLPASARSDVNILIVVNPKTHKILTVTTPRDMYVDLASSGAKDKLTHAGVYGVNESLRTLENFYQTKIDYYARVNFDTLTKVVDTLGGVDVYSDVTFKAYDGHTFTEGMNHMDGSAALAFARERKSLPEGDRARGKHQQLVIEAIFKKMLQPETLLRANSIIDTLSTSLQTNLSSDSIKTLVRNQLDTMAKWEFENIAANGSGDMQPTYSMGSQLLYVMWPDMSTVETARTRIADTLAQ